MGTALRRLADELTAALARVLAYIGVLAALGAVTIHFLDVGDVSAAIEAAPRSDWTAVERPYRAFALNSPNLPEPDYAIRRHTAGGRKDVLTVGAEDGGAPRLMVEIYRPGRETEHFGTSATEAAARTDDLGGPYELTSTNAIVSKFGRFAVFEFTAKSDGAARNCLAFVRAFIDPRLQIAGWYCKSDTEVVDRRTLACALEGLSLLAAASDPKAQQLFASAEQKRTFCAPRTVLRGAALRRHDWIEGPNRPKLRRGVATK